MLLHANKLIEKNALAKELSLTKEHYQSFTWKKPHKISKTIRNNYLSTTEFWKPKHCWYNINNYRTSKNLT